MTEKKQTIIKTTEWEVMTPTGWQSFDGVVITHDVNVIEIDGLVCTPEHRIEIEDVGLVEAQSILHKTLPDKTDVFDLLNVDNGNLYFTNSLISHNCLYLDEFAFVPNTQADDFFTAVFPTLSAGKNTKIFMTSTPNGYNHFHKFWVEAEKPPGKGWNGFKQVRVHWHETPGRDQKWYDEQKAVLGELKAAQEIDACLWGKSTVTIRDKETGKIIETNLETLHDFI